MASSGGGKDRSPAGKSSPRKTFRNPFSPASKHSKRDADEVQTGTDSDGADSAEDEVRTPEKEPSSSKSRFRAFFGFQRKEKRPPSTNSSDQDSVSSPVDDRRSRGRRPSTQERDADLYKKYFDLVFQRLVEAKKTSNEEMAEMRKMLLRERATPPKDEAERAAFIAAAAELEQFIKDWLALSSDQITSTTIKDEINRLLRIQDSWHVDWPAHHLIYQPILILARVAPIIEHLDLDPEEFNSTVALEPDRLQESIEKDIYSTLWSVPFKFLESGEEAESQDLLVRCRICEDILPHEQLETHSNSCVTLTQCEMELQEVDQQLIKVKEKVKAEMTRFTVYGSGSQSESIRRDKRVLEETISVIEATLAYINTDAIIEASTMATFESAHRGKEGSESAAQRLAAQTATLINKKFKIVRRGLSASREQDAARKMRALSTLQEIIEESTREPQQSRSTPSTISHSSMAGTMRRSRSIMQAYLRQVARTEALQSQLMRRPTREDLAERNILTTSPGVTPSPPGSVRSTPQKTYPFGVRSKPPSMQDFEIIKNFSRGAFGRVFLAKKRSTGDYFAIKVLRKHEMKMRAQQDNVRSEQNILSRVDNPYVVKLFYSFESESNLYLVMEYLPGGDLYSLLRKFPTLDYDWAKFYVAEVVLALDYLHSSEPPIVHRDLKPDNLLIDRSGHIKLTDFGLSRTGLVTRASNLSRVLSTQQFNSGSARLSMIIRPDKDKRDRNDSSSSSGNNSMSRAMSILKKREHVSGTPDYLAPETIMGLGYGPAVDFWAVGIILYEMVVGIPPFNDEEPGLIFGRILTGAIEWPEDMDPVCKDLIEKLLTRDPEKRLGSQSAREVMQHPFFKDVDWANLLNSPAPFIPQPQSAEDTEYFESRANRPASLLEDMQSAKPVVGGGATTEEGEFGNFAYKSLNFLQRANYDVVKNRLGSNATKSPSDVNSSSTTLNRSIVDMSPDFNRTASSTDDKYGSSSQLSASTSSLNAVPAAPPSSASSSTAALNDAPRIPRVLLVSGNPVIRRSFGATLRRRGILISVVSGGVEAVSAQRHDGQPYDTIFVEMALHDMTGLEAAKLIRTENPSNRNAPIILFSPIQDDKDAFTEGGGLAYVSGDLIKLDIEETIDLRLPLRQYTTDI